MNKYATEIKGRLMNLQSWILVFDSIVASSAIELGFSNILSLSTTAEESCSNPDTTINSDHLFITSTLQFIIFTVLYPFTGWLADTKIGREKAIHLSLWSCWLGTVLQVVSYCIQYGTCGLPVNIAKYGISGVALVMIIIGTAGLNTNIPPYGIDQLYDKPNTHSRAFIHWIVWGTYVGYSCSYIAFVPQSIYNPALLMITAMLILLVNSIALLLHAWFNHRFELSGVLQKNPYKLVYQVLKYAFQHKFPENRSALTYWEDKIPSRISLGKRKYGGPFTEGDVEDTKSFWRILSVLLSTFGFFIGLYYTVLGILQYANSFMGATEFNGYMSYIAWSSFQEVTIILVPIVELVIIPLFPKIEYFILNPLRGLGVTYILMILTLISMLVIDTVGHFINDYDLGCFLSASPQYEQLDMSYLYYLIPFLTSSLLGGLSTIFILEFICSQAPVNMSGMLTGMFWLIRGVYVNTGTLLLIPFKYLDANGPGKISCSFWSLLIQLFICVFGFIVYIVISKRYKQRKREENYDIYMMNVLEDNYIRKFNEIGTKDESDEVFVIESLRSPYISAKKATSIN